MLTANIYHHHTRYNSNKLNIVTSIGAADRGARLLTLLVCLSVCLSRETNGALHSSHPALPCLQVPWRLLQRSHQTVPVPQYQKGQLQKQKDWVSNGGCQQRVWGMEVGSRRVPKRAHTDYIHEVHHMATHLGPPRALTGQFLALTNNLTYNTLSTTHLYYNKGLITVIILLHNYNEYLGMWNKCNRLVS